jgi:glycosyltransferase involved in cell wall biosynthesis
VHTHGSCTHVIAHDSEDDYALPIAYRLSDAVVCLDDMDRAFWSQFNARSFTTVNRSSFSTSEVAAAPLASHKIIWVGRMSMDEKRPMDAIEILSRVRLSVPDARLEMVGPGEPGVFERLRSRARELGVDDAVSFLGPRDDVSSLMSGASVHLLTSPSEGFSLVVLESKTCGVPCVMYQLPIRFSREGKGVANVRQGDLDGAAAAIVRLLQDDDLRHRMGVEARERQGDRDV